MAAAWFNALAHPDKARALSAGTDPAGAVDPHVVGAMKNVGIDIGASRPTPLTPQLAGTADLVVVIGPPLPEGALSVACERDEWLVDNPVGQAPERVVEALRGIEKLVRQLLVARHWMPFGASTPPASLG